MPSGSIDGIISNLDTSAIIDAILQYEARNATLINERKTEVTNKITSWNSVSAYLLGFKSKASTLSKESAWNTKSVTNSDDTIFTATATSSAALGTYYINVNQLAQQHQLASQGFSATTTGIGTGTVQIQVGDNATETITIDSDNNTLAGLRDAINNTNAGVTASIINDGSSGNPYRLLLSADETGVTNTISVTTSLSGGTAPDFASSSFDTPETIIWDSNATSTVSLGSSASYTGSENKTYTFTIQGDGAQTVGSGDITINWTDGTDSGSITVSAADTEVSLTGDGSDGLTLSFGSGVLYGGDTFQVQTFSPELQEASDAIITFGSDSPVTINSSTNTITDVIEGVTLNLLKVSDSGANTLKVEIDKESIKNNIQGLIDTYNQLTDYIDELMDYNPETEEAGILIGDMSLINLQNHVRGLATNPISGLDSDLNELIDIGITVGTDGHLKLDSSTLYEKLDDDLQGVVDLFRMSAQSSNSKIEFISATDDTEMTSTGYAVNVTQIATKGSYQGTDISDPSVNNLVIDENNYKFKIRVNGVLSDDIELTQQTYTSGAQLAEEIEAQINADETLGDNDVTVSWVDGGDNGHFVVESTKYGSTSAIELLSSSQGSGVTTLGFANGTSTDGVDVEGTINGESATGSGQILTGDSDNTNTAGLSLKITLSESDLTDNAAEGTITLARGIASLLSYELDDYTDSYDGSIASRVSGLQKQIDLYNDQLEELNTRLTMRREQLYKQFYAMEQTISQLQNEQQYFSAQLAQMKSLF
ncbi:MAG: flagellar filament capping protein FliD [candidate division Zixibacteria bacterium]|nr:flagellar filament capping protein FliD [candidate division Zixibacteria bacterium]